MLKDTRWDYRPERPDWPYRIKTPYDAFAFRAIILMSGLAAALIWLIPVYLWYEQGAPYLYEFFERLR